MTGEGRVNNIRQQQEKGHANIRKGKQGEGARPGGGRV